MSIHNHEAPGASYYLLSAEEPRVYGVFKTVKECEQALKEGEWEMGYMEDIGMKNPDKKEERQDYLSGTVIGIVAHGHVKIETYPRCDIPPEIRIHEDDYVKCLERRHPDLEYVCAFRATGSTCIKL